VTTLTNRTDESVMLATSHNCDMQFSLSMRIASLVLKIHYAGAPD
jgi:hypothetical protein